MKVDYSAIRTDYGCNSRVNVHHSQAAKIHSCRTELRAKIPTSSETDAVSRRKFFDSGVAKLTHIIERRVLIAQTHGLSLCHAVGDISMYVIAVIARKRGGPPGHQESFAAKIKRHAQVFLPGHIDTRLQVLGAIVEQLVSG